MTIGADVVVMENAVVRGRERHPVAIGDAVMVGPHAHINGAVIERESFIATGASLFPGSFVGTRSELRINAVLQVNSRLGPGTVVPIGWVAVGDPAQLFSPDRHDEIWAVQRELNFVGTVYDVPRGTSMRDLMRGQSEFYGAHRGDAPLDGDAITRGI